MNPVIKPVFLHDDRLYIIDQRLLPNEEKIIELRNEDEVYSAIKTLSVRGAPAIGIAAAYGVYISLKNKSISNKTVFIEKAIEIIERISLSRPTAFNLFYAMDRMKKLLNPYMTNTEILSMIKAEAEAIHNEDIEKSIKIADFGLSVIPDKARIISHCNAGGLATGGLGTSLAVIYRAFQEKKDIFVYVDETRPLLQGSRLTAWELSKAGIKYKIISDSMAGLLMQKNLVDLVLVGADRIAANGDFANKIGTYPLAVLAHYHGIPFYTAAPVSTFDFTINCGNEIPIEERDKDELLSFNGVRIAPIDADAYNPAFDVTPGSLVTGIITEFGVIYPPLKSNLMKISGLTRK